MMGRSADYGRGAIRIAMLLRTLGTCRMWVACAESEDFARAGGGGGRASRQRSRRMSRRVRRESSVSPPSASPARASAAQPEEADAPAAPGPKPRKGLTPYGCLSPRSNTDALLPHRASAQGVPSCGGSAAASARLHKSSRMQSPQTRSWAAAPATRRASPLRKGECRPAARCRASA